MVDNLICLQAPSVQPTTGDAFEDVLYGSGSEGEDEEDEEDKPSAHVKTHKKASEYGARIRADDDDPMDLLSGAAARVTGEPQAAQRSCVTNVTKAHHPTDGASLVKMHPVSKLTRKQGR